MSETQSKHRSILTALTRLDAHYRFMVSVGVTLVCYASFFIIGMTSQVSDVQIGSREVRRLALLHGLISFAFNTAVLALGINIASGLF